MAKIKKDSFTPLYQQVLEALKKDISQNKIPVGSKIPTEIELCASYGVSRITIRRAIAQLCEEGLLIRKQGKGTFVASTITRANMPQVLSFHDNVESQGKVPSVKVIHVREMAGAKQDWEALKIAPNSRIIESSRVLFADKDAVIYEINHYSMAYMYLLESNLNGSLYDVFKNYGVEPSHSTYTISQVKATSAIANLMGVADDSPLILINEIVYDQHMRPLHTSAQYFRGDILTFRI